MKEIIKKRWNRYKQTISMFSIIFILAACCITFFMSLSDAGYGRGLRSLWYTSRNNSKLFAEEVMP